MTRDHSLSMIERKSFSQQAADTLRKGILEGRLQPGSRLGEAWLAEQLQLSRGTVRAALRELTHEGLVRAIPYSGWEIVEFSVKDAEDLCAVRTGLETMAAKLAAQNISPDGAQRLSDDYQKLLNAARRQNQAECVERDLALHRTIFDLTKNGRLIEIYKNIEQQIRVCVAFSDLRCEFDEIALWHTSLVEAIVNGDADAAERIAKDNAERNSVALISQLKRNSPQGNQDSPAQSSVKGSAS
jgi:DNA-binding GntR family transcriptional regulator